jgi:hypothetical protein
VRQAQTHTHAPAVTHTNTHTQTHSHSRAHTAHARTQALAHTHVTLSVRGRRVRAVLASWPLDIVKIGVLVIGANDGDLRKLLCVFPKPTGPTDWPPPPRVCTGTKWAHPAQLNGLTPPQIHVPRPAAPCTAGVLMGYSRGTHGVLTHGMPSAVPTHCTGTVLSAYPCQPIRRVLPQARARVPLRLLPRVGPRRLAAQGRVRAQSARPKRERAARSP